jgi:glycosyltransferase involved in cell wall biosynthesis
MSDRRRLRFAYLSGPVDGELVYDSWVGSKRLEYFGTSYLAQFYQTCADYDADGYIITTTSAGYRLRRAGPFIIENRPIPPELGGLRYHIAYSIWILRILPSLIRFRPDIFVITAGHNYWIFLSVLKLFGVAIVPAIHDSLWNRFLPLKLSWRILRRVEALFFAMCVKDTIVAAASTAAQVRSLVPGKNIGIEVFLPSYDRSQFGSVQPPDFHKRPFEILFMGRIVANKGIYDVLDIAAGLNPAEFHFNMCGEGPELDGLRHQAGQRGLNAIVTCHGFLDRNELYALIDRVHAVLVPTTTGFEEGFNMVCAEAILAGRPVVTSAVCPALFYIRDAAIEVPPNDVDSYRRALLDLATDRLLYEEKCSATALLREQFYDPRNTWTAKLRNVIDKYVRPRTG